MPWARWIRNKARIRTCSTFLNIPEWNVNRVLKSLRNPTTATTKTTPYTSINWLAGREQIIMLHVRHKLEYVRLRYVCIITRWRAMLGNNFMQFVHILIIPLGKRKYGVFFFLQNVDETIPWFHEIPFGYLFYFLSWITNCAQITLDSSFKITADKLLLTFDAKFHVRFQCRYLRNRKTKLRHFRFRREPVPTVANASFLISSYYLLFELIQIYDTLIVGMDCGHWKRVNLSVVILARKQALLSHGDSKKKWVWWLALKKVTNPLISGRAPYNRLKSMRAGFYVYGPCSISLMTLRSHKEYVMGNFTKPHRIYVKLSHINFHLKLFGIKQCWEPGSIILQGQWLQQNAELLHVCLVTCFWLFRLINFFDHRQPNEIFMWPLKLQFPSWSSQCSKLPQFTSVLGRLCWI